MGGGCQSKPKAKLQSKPKSKPKSKEVTYELDVLTDHAGGINAMAVSEDESILATGSDDHTVRLWTTRTDRCECIGVMSGHEDYINCVLIEDTYVVSGSADKTIRKWDMSTCACVAVLRGHASTVNRIICTGDFIFSSSYDRTARCWDFDSGEFVREFRGHRRSVYPLMFVPSPQDDEEGANNDLLVTGSADFTAIAWSFETAEPLQTFKEHTGAITCMAVDPSGKILLTGATDYTARSWDLRSGEALKVFEGHKSSIVCMTVVNRVLYTGSSDQTARSWVMEFGDCTRVYKGHEHTVGCIKFHNSLVVTGCGDGIARCFDAKSGALKRTLKGHAVSINVIQVIDDKLYTGSHDATMRIWDVGNIKGDTQFGVDEKDEKAKKSGPGDDVRGGPPSKGMNGKPPNGEARINPAAEKPRRIMIGEEGDENQNHTKQGHLISIGKTTSTF